MNTTSDNNESKIKLMITVDKNKKSKSNYTIISGFISGGLASICATTITNPIELVKTRLQLQGELNISQRVYSGVFDAFRKIYTSEGIRGLQRGLIPAYFSQGTMQATRLGTFDVFSQLLGAHADQDYFFIKNLLAGASAGALGAALGSPFDLVKVRMQAATMFPNDPQFQGYTSSWAAYRQIIEKEGWRGLCRGMSTSSQRTAVGSGIQLSTYGSAKQLLVNTGLFEHKNTSTHLMASLLAGFIVTIGMNPFDVARTRLYYQGKGNSHGEKYKSLFDCIYKTTKAEGFMALYKGFWAHYLRLGPHTIATLVFWEEFKKLFAKFE
ncbi:transmembrane protein [Tieghemostelium lacteum]|uniref:Transmembrane protein n=1 Tax=Tieghemostelium lacteum TaxID=361077 RepID=A0A151ZEE4_TIELA|nr:transmembrane protein [Tieghemostelium lacteum]|eukprot:KYQ92328.1 transmembrane protein [Tieghemostelium lacteum]